MKKSIIVMATLLASLVVKAQDEMQETYKKKRSTTLLITPQKGIRKDMVMLPLTRRSQYLILNQEMYCGIKSMEKCQKTLAR